MRRSTSLEQRSDVERFVEVVGQQLEAENLLANRLLVADLRRRILRHERREDRVEHVLAKIAVGFLATAHHLGVEPNVVVDLLPLVERCVEPVAEDEGDQRQRQHLDQLDPRPLMFAVS
jgi:hypothetical protein